MHYNEIDVNRLREVVPIGITSLTEKFYIQRSSEEADIDIKHINEASAVAWHDVSRDYLNIMSGKEELFDSVSPHLKKLLDTGVLTKVSTIEEDFAEMKGNLHRAELREAKMQGMIEVYERLIAGGYTTLTK